MHHARLLLAFAALALAACSVEAPELVSPLSVPDAAHSLSSTGKGRFILRAGVGGFGSDLETRVANLGGKVERKHGAAGIAVVSEISDADATTLARGSGIVEVEADMIVSLADPVASAQADATGLGDVEIQSQTNPATAARYSFQWNMRLIGADKAWAAGKLGSSDVTVAILDTGIDYNAPDLNGLVDLTRSTSFNVGDDSITATYFPSRNKINDYNGHGTNVATQVSSKAVALAGVTSKTTLMGVKGLGAEGSGFLSDVLNGVLWAADHQADVANMSLGGGFARNRGNQRFVKLINQTFDYAYQKGMVVVVAAGNAGSDLDHNGTFFASYCDASHVICVSSVGPTVATGNPDTPSYFTNFGKKSIDVAGPGGNAGAVISAWPWGNSKASYVWSFCAKHTLATDSLGVLIKPLAYAGCQAGNRLTGMAGTSQASPHVAGLAALLVAEYGHFNPTLVKTYIELTSKDLGPKGADAYYGHGRIDVENAVSLALPKKFAADR